MAYRSDQEALAAREAALRSELADKAREHRDVGHQLEQARAELAAASSPDSARRRRRKRLLVGLLAGPLVVGGIVAGIVVLKRGAPAPTQRAGLSCSAVDPTYRALERTAEVAFGIALASRGLSPITLESRPTSSEASLTDEANETVAGQPITPWLPFAYAVEGGHAPSGYVGAIRASRPDVPLREGPRRRSLARSPNTQVAPRDERGRVCVLVGLLGRNAGRGAPRIRPRALAPTGGLHVSWCCHDRVRCADARDHVRRSRYRLQPPTLIRHPLV